MSATNPYLSLPLDGVRLIEASAGTGKTFTLATLFTRLVVERQLRIGQILAVTFTEAATQELRKRIRERLTLAANLADAPDPGSTQPDIALTSTLLLRHLADSGESVSALQRRLRMAAEEIDLAAIFTIHGFCARVLSEHALDSGHGFAATELLANTRELQAEIAADLWRRHGNDGAHIEALTTLWRAPDALAKALDVLSGPLPLHPVALPGEAHHDDPRGRLSTARQSLADAWRMHGEAYVAAVLSAIDAGVLSKQVYKTDWVHALGQQLQAWAMAADPYTVFDPRLAKLTLEALNAKTNKAHAGKAPVSPLQPVIADYAAAVERVDAWQQRQAVALLHELRIEARASIAQRKQQFRWQTYDDLIDGVADALDGATGAQLVARLRAQYRIALVDEFQDTDARQWSIFRRVFGDSEEVRAAGEAPALFLIGDPKQAIYGFRGGDVHTYLQARETAEIAPALDHNFRSRPGVLRAIEALYANAGAQAFVESGIEFMPVQAGDRRSDGDYSEHGAPAPALTLRVIKSETGTLRADASRDAVTAACVADIHRVLSGARAETTLIDGKPVQPGDIAVLVRSHREATRIQQALAHVGIPAVAAGKQSLFSTPEARDVHLLLRALLQPADDGRLRAALATDLLGLDAQAIAALDAGSGTHDWQLRAFAWSEQWRRSGVFALIAGLCAEQAERLLGLFDGERRLTNYLQLAEHLQQASTQALGLHGLLDWLQQQIAWADDNDEAQLLRLESDAHRVQIVTLHKSKGLEYPLVYLPFVGIGTKGSNTAQWQVVHDAHGRRVQWKLDKTDPDWLVACSQAEAERRAEDARLLYVGLTRAEHALWIAAGDLAEFDASRLAPMIEGHLDTLAEHADVRIVQGPAEPVPDRLPREREAAVPPPRIAHRHIAPDWWVYSFTQLANADAGHDVSAAATEDAGAASDEPAQPEDLDATVVPVAGDASTTPAAPVDDAGTAAYDPVFSGSRFGNVLHGALELTDFGAWATWRDGDPAPEGQAEILLDALRKEGYGKDDLERGLALMTALVGRTLTVDLPEGGALHAVPEGERRSEIEFHFAMQPTAVPALLDLLHAHGVVRDRHGFGLRRRLEGLMTGKIDLTYVRDGRWYVLDYKSNRLPRYDGAQLAAAMAHSEYDLQALVYTVALHRWLRFRLGERYDYARDFGGIRYLFCRGLDTTQVPVPGAAAPGVFAHRYAPALVHALDALFAGNAPRTSQGTAFGVGATDAQARPSA